MKDILLTEPEIIPTITHWHICSWKLEVPRNKNGEQIPGHIDVWLARVYRIDDVCYEDGRLVGKNIRIEGPEFDEFINIPTSTNGLLEDSLVILGQFLIDKGYFNGVVEE